MYRNHIVSAIVSKSPVYINLRITAALICIIPLMTSPLPAQRKAPVKQEKKEEKIKTIAVELADEPVFSVMGKRLSLGNAIKIILEQNKDTLSGAYDVAMTDSAYESYLGKYSAKLNMEGGAGYREYPSEMGVIVPDNEKTAGLSASIAKMFRSGTTVSAGVIHDYYKSKLRPVSLGGPGEFSLGNPEYHQPVMFVALQQELLKNVFGINDRKQIEIHKNTGKMNKDYIIYNLASLVVSIVVDYWTVVINSSAVENTKLQLQETRKVQNIIDANVRLGLAEPHDLYYYNSLVASAESSVARVKQDYRDSLNELLTTLDLERGTALSDSTMLVDKLPDINYEQALKTAYEKRADYTNAVLSLKNAKLNLEIYENRAMPSLSAEFEMSSIAQKDSIPPAYSETSSMKYPAFEGRLKLSYPLDDRGRRVNERNARFRAEQAKLQLDKYRRIVKDDIISKIEHISTDYVLYQKAMEARIQSEKYYYRLVRNLRRGRLTASVVKDGLFAMVESRQREREALIYYNLSLLQFDLSKNILFEKYNINVDDYIPKNK